MNADLLLRFAYGANVVILTPVVASLLSGPASRIFGPQTPDVVSMKLLIASLWGAILVCSVIGLFQPRVMLAILVLQVVYKSAWLLLFVAPTWHAGDPVPWGPTLVFLPIVLLWPAAIAAAWR